jgi:hypothetical protein
MSNAVVAVPKLTRAQAGWYESAAAMSKRMSRLRKRLKDLEEARGLIYEDLTAVFKEHGARRMRLDRNTVLERKVVRVPAHWQAGYTFPQWNEIEE